MIVLLDNAMLLGSLSVWLGCLIVTCMLLIEKGRSGLGGFFAYLLFPVGALIYAAAVPALSAAQTNATPNAALFPRAEEAAALFARAEEARKAREAKRKAGD